MIYNDKYSLLFIEPTNPPSSKPVIDKYTLKILYELTNFISVGNTSYNSFSPNIATMGVHRCTGEGCTEYSSSFDLLLPCGLSTNTLALHYISYHRDEVPILELEKIDNLCTMVDESISFDDKEYMHRASKFLEENHFNHIPKILPYDFNYELFFSGGYNVQRLKEVLKYMSLDTKGKKSELIERIKRNINV